MEWQRPNWLVRQFKTEKKHSWTTGRTVGAAIRTVEGGKPIYVSVGNLVSLKTAIEIVKKCIRSGGYPEPLRQAHVTASELKRQLERTSDLQKT